MSGSVTYEVRYSNEGHIMSTRAKSASTKPVAGPSKSNSKLPSFPVLVGTCLGYTAYRGFAPLSELAKISDADIFDQDKNKLGTQRNLSVQHARKAYEYVSATDRAFYPEMILNVRDKAYVNFSALYDHGDVQFGMLTLKEHPKNASAIIVSRLDGNHRLWFADGHERGMAPVGRPVSFCLLTIEDREKELELFRDINDNQMGMNTSHLQNITARLLGDKLLKVQNPASYIVQKLMKDKTSPLYRRVHQGGKVQKGATLSGLTIANLTSAIRDMLTRSAKLAQFPDADAQYQVIKNFWIAVKEWLPKAWNSPRDYAIFKGVGLYAISYVGIEVIDRSLLKGKFSSDDMLVYLKQMPPESLASGGTAAYSGRGGGRKLANDLIANLEEEGEVSLSKLQKLILSEA
jgi:DGQHR domain-containing protein